MIVEICGYAVEIDDDCEEIVRGHHWAIYDSRTTPDHPYVWTTIGNKMTALHRVIMGNPTGMHVDHRDGNPLNNRRDNLRLCTRSQNKANSKLYRNNRSGFKGVIEVPGRRKWQASIYRDRRQIYLGRFSTPEQAHEAYKAAAVEIYGEFARFA